MGTPFLERWGATPWRLALIMLAVGFFSVFVVQMELQYQIVLGAPIFEEMLKFGLALLLVSWLPDPHGRGGLWAVVMPLRVLAALAVGAAFGVIEHETTYPMEGTASYIQRILFHSLAPLSSMVSYTLLEPVWDVRVRWAATVVPTFLHYVNNSLAVLLGIGTFAFRIPDVVPLTMSGTISALLVLSIIVMPWFGGRVRGLALREVGRRLDRHAAPRRVAVPDTRNPSTTR